MRTATALAITLLFAASSARSQPAEPPRGDPAPETGAQSQAPSQLPETAAENAFEKVSHDVKTRLEAALAELRELQERAAAETVPLSRKLSDLESELVEARGEYQQAARTHDSRTLELSNLQSRIKSRKEEMSYLSNLLGEYVRNLETRMHIAELQRYGEPLDAAKLAPENKKLSDREVLQAQAQMLDVSLERLFDALGGTRFEGAAVDTGGGNEVKPGRFVLVGPTAIFRSDDGQAVGTVEQQLGSLEPSIIPFATPADAQAAAEVVVEGEGRFPLDPTLGNAHKIEATQQTLWEHIQKGGPVMVPILAMAGAALLVAVYKWITMMFVGKPSPKQLRNLLEAIRRRDRAAAAEQARRVRGPAGKMLRVGVEHLGEPRELIEEVMYETVLATRLKLRRLLPFIAICAASAPLLGLLGTVTGIINTFKLITVFGSGDVKMLSGGISEALITTEFGLIVAIPSLLLHAFLSRKARGVTDEMEKSAIAFVNQVAKSSDRDDEAAEVAADWPPKADGPEADADGDEQDKQPDTSPKNADRERVGATARD